MHLVFDWSQTFFISLSSPLSCRVLKAEKKKKVHFHFQYTNMVLQVSGKESLLKGRNPTKCEEPSRAQSVPQGQENRPEFHWHMVTFIIFSSLLSLSFPQINLDTSIPVCQNAFVGLQVTKNEKTMIYNDSKDRLKAVFLLTEETNSEFTNFNCEIVNFTIIPTSM